MIISDELNHASIIDGCRLSKAAIKVFPHKDAAAARTILQGLPASQRKLLITDGVFSMDGDVGALPALCELAEEFGCRIMMVDDAHASGVFGKNGRPGHGRSLRHARPRGHPGRHLVEGDGRARRLRGRIEVAHRVPLSSRAPVLVLDVASTVGRGHVHRRRWTCSQHDPAIIERLWDNTRFFKAGLKALGFNTGLSESPITPVIAGEGSRAMKLSDRLFEEGVFAQGIAFPTVARDKARVRTIVTATHTRAELQFALDKFEKVGRELGLI